MTGYYTHHKAFALDHSRPVDLVFRATDEELVMASADLIDDPTTTYSKITCIGAGVSGICLGAQLQRFYGEKSIAFFDKQHSVAGTWTANRYPGTACDVPCALYSYSFEQRSTWSRVFPRRAEIESYLQEVASKYDLLSKMQFGVQVTKCIWLEDAQKWKVEGTQTTPEGVKRQINHESQILYLASGLLRTPKSLDVPGSSLDTFNGPIFHSARWDHSVSLKDKSVLVIGNGCSATQIVPTILPEVKSLTQIFRSQQWIFPPADAPHSAFQTWIFKYIPFALRCYRLLCFLGSEQMWGLSQGTAAGQKLRDSAQVIATKYLRSTAPEKYHDIMIPTYPVGCKRIVLDNAGYLKSLHSEKVQLLKTSITSVLPDGVMLSNGTTIKTDVIVLANGFETNKPNDAPVNVIGRNGESLTQHWHQAGGPEAYNTTSLSGFPNFFMLLGPNSATGHTSAIIAVENTVNYSLRCLAPVLGGRKKVIEVKPEAETAYTKQLQRDLGKTVWAMGCQSWYVRQDAQGKFEWNGMSYPYSQYHFWWRSFRVRWKDYLVDVSLCSFLFCYVLSTPLPRVPARRDLDRNQTLTALCDLGSRREQFHKYTDGDGSDGCSGGCSHSFGSFSTIETSN